MSEHGVWCYTEDGSSELCNVPDCQECGTVSQRKEDYRGTTSISSTGKTCVPWADKEEELSTILLRPLTVYTFGELGLEENFCRNAGGLRAAPWCFIDESSTDWEFCMVSDCVEADFEMSFSNETTTCGSFSHRQSDYRGAQNMTASGRSCQNWNSQVPHPHKYSPGERPLAGLDDNFCRNPDSASKSAAWCFTDDEDQRWEYCNIPFCENERVDSFPTVTECGTLALGQKDYRGPANMTESGLACQEWSSQSPHPHSFDPATLPASAGLEGNHCRNPDGSGKAWCFTLDPEILWEYCNIPACEANNGQL